MSGWGTSTQRSRWIFDQEALAEQRRRSNERAAAHIVQLHKLHEEEEKANGAGAPSDPTAPAADAGNGEGKRKRGREREGGVEPLSAEEERALCVFYERKLAEVCRAFQFPSKVLSTALQQLKRFFLRHSVMEHHPKSIMLTVVYVACKIDEAYVSAEALGNGIKQDPQIVLDNELTVLQALDFDLICHGPYKPLHGLLDDWRRKKPDAFLQAKGAPSPLEALRHEARGKIQLIMATDAPLLFPPSQIALAALTMALDPPSPVQHLQPQLSAYIASLEKQLPPQGPKDPPSLQDAIQRILKLVAEQGAQPDEARVRRIERRLRLCMDPSLRSEGAKKKKDKKDQSRAPE